MGDELVPIELHRDDFVLVSCPSEVLCQHRVPTSSLMLVLCQPD